VSRGTAVRRTMLSAAAARCGCVCGTNKEIGKFSSGYSSDLRRPKRFGTVQEVANISLHALTRDSGAVAPIFREPANFMFQRSQHTRVI
jgi:hypothetical protein